MQKSMSGIVKKGKLARGLIVRLVSLHDVGALFVFITSWHEHLPPWDTLKSQAGSEPLSCLKPVPPEAQDLPLT